MHETFPPQLKKIIIDKLIDRGAVSPEDREAYIVTGVMIYERVTWGYRLGIRAPFIIEDQPASARYMSRLARMFRIGGKPYRTAYLTPDETIMLLREAASKCPDLFGQIRQRVYIQ